jgi:nitroimidazol reductase NimA-like FMN-containing flavoprotein (pyridoxamine 5'-phosphate oxidase superfamily)
MIDSHAQERLTNSANIWLATVRPNATPHLIPIWLVWLDGKAYICTPRDSVKVRNIEKQPRVTFALEDGDNPLVIEGAAKILDSIPEKVAEVFQTKYDWDIRSATANVVIEITPRKVLDWRA